MVGGTSALDRKLLRDLWSLKAQLIAIALVMASGLATFVMSLSTLDSLDSARDAYYERYRFADVFAHAKRAPRTLLPRLEQIPGVAWVEARIVSEVTVDVAGMAEPATARLISLPDHNPPVLNNLYLRAGRLPEPFATTEIVVSEAFAKVHKLGPGGQISAVVNGKWRRLDIVGIALSPEFIFTLRGGVPFPDDTHFGVFWMGQQGMEAAFDLEGSFNDLSVALLRHAREAEVIARVDHLLAPYGGTGAYGRVDHLSDWFLSNELNQLRSMGLLGPLIFLSVSAFLINVVLSRLIATEREIIGTLKAFGYRDVEIGWHYMKLMLAIVGLGVVLGVAVGAWLGRELAELYTEYFRFPALQYHLTPAIPATALLMAVVVGVFSTLRTIVKAVRMRPAEAMRPAPPKAFRATVIEKIGLQIFLGQLGRIILRNLSRQPYRSVLSGLGIALSVAIMIAVSFWLDAVNHIMYVEFDLAHREHVSVAFSEPRPDLAVAELRRLPGVMRAESYRAVAAKLRNGHHTRRLAVIGLADQTIMHRELDSNLRAVTLPGEGVMLSRKLAEGLDVSVGEILEIEVLEGRRPTAHVRVSGLFDTFIGMSALMEIGALNALMEEQPVISGAYLQIDSRVEAALYQELKATPVISGVALRRSMLESFRETMAENILIMTLFNVGFASIIAFGVVYNSVRIALSERRHELATMRVIGLTRAEVSYVLLGEFGVITAAALPLGCVIGYGLGRIWANALSTELFRIPFVISSGTYGFSILVILVAVVVSSLIVRRRIDRLDLVAVLKNPE